MKIYDNETLNQSLQETIETLTMIKEMYDDFNKEEELFKSLKKEHKELMNELTITKLQCNIVLTSIQLELKGRETLLSLDNLDKNIVKMWRLNMEIKNFTKEHLVDAAKLFIDLYKKQRTKTPLLPVIHEDINDIIGYLKRILVYKCPSLVAVKDGKLVGYMMGYLSKDMKGSQKGVFIPEWAHAANYHDRLKIYQELYNKLSTIWVEMGHYNHAIHVLADDFDERNLWFWQGFGMLGVDAIRPLEKIEINKSPDIKIKVATMNDVDKLLSIGILHQKYLSKAPLFLPIFELDDHKYFEDIIKNGKNIIYIACKDDEFIGYMTLEQTEPNAIVVGDSNTVSIKGAYVKPLYRGRGIATLLLSKMIDWAKLHNYQRIAVDFESANIFAKNYWLRHFKPVCYSLIRHIDDRIELAVNRV